MNRRAFYAVMRHMTGNGPTKAIHAVSGNAVDTIDQAIKSPQCQACGRPEQIIWVHSHGQFAHCHTNVMGCFDATTRNNLP